MTRWPFILGLVALLSGADYAPAQTVPPLLPPEGLSDPTLALGLSGLADWGSARPFIDQMLTARPWFGAAGGDWETMDSAALMAGGYVDEQGWVTRMPPGIDVIRTIWAYGKDSARERAGTYILTYEGEGRIRLNGDARRIDGRPGRIVFSTEGGPFWLDLSELDPRGIGKPIRNISIVQDKHQALYEAGAIFRPEWIELIKEARLIRFMDWTATNGSRVVSGEAPLIDASGLWRMKGRGVPVSMMVELANQIGADPWFSMPHMADDAYVRAYAEYVYANLNPDLVAHVEYSNEVWNEAFPQGRWVREQASAIWGVPYGHEGGLAFVAREATRDALIWEDVYGADATTRLSNVLATQALNTWATGLLLTPEAWIEAEPETYLPVDAVFDSLAVTTYFGGRIMASEATRSELVARIQQDPADAGKWLTEQLSNTANPDTPGSNRPFLEEQKALATSHGLDFVAYEGGQHVHHSFAVPGLTEKDIQAVTDFMIAFVRGPEMAQITKTNWDIWEEIGDGPYMHYGDSGGGGRSGTFSLVDAPGLSNPTADLLMDLNRNTSSWWGDTGGTRYQQGRRIDGNERNNALSGTIRGDVLLAGAGDDLLNPGPGLDHLHGGDGTDTVVLPDMAGSITYDFEGSRTVVRGPSGRWHLFSIEHIRFADGTEIDTPRP